jgi:hypothetical protein
MGGGYILTKEEQITNKFFLLSLKKLLSAYMENTLNGEKRTKTDITLLIIAQQEKKL